MKRLSALTLLLPIAALAADTCRAPSQWAELHDVDDAWSSWQLDSGDTAVAGPDWQELHQQARQEAADSLGVSVEELEQQLADREARAQAWLDPAADLYADFGAELRANADRLQLHGDSHSLVAAAMLLTNPSMGNLEHAQHLLSQAMALDPKNPLVLWAAIAVCPTTAADGCSQRDAARTLVGVQPDNIAAWWALLARADHDAAEEAVDGALAAGRYEDGMQALREVTSDAFQQVGMSTVLEADLARMMADLMGPSQIKTADGILALMAMITLHSHAPDDAGVYQACAASSDTDSRVTVESCRDHYLLVAQQADSAVSLFLAHRALVVLAADPAERQYWQQQQLAWIWGQYQLTKAQTEGRLALDDAFVRDVLILGERESGRLRLQALGLPSEPPDDWDAEEAMRAMYTESLRQSF